MESETPQHSSPGKFFALNAQCIVDDKKICLWVSYYNKGGSHYSSYRKGTKLYSILESIKDELYQLVYFILGDLAYATESFLLPPCDSPTPMESEDNFNFLI